MRGRRVRERLSSLSKGKLGVPLLLVAAIVLVLLVVADASGALTRVGQTAPDTKPLSSAGCTYTVSTDGKELVAVSSSGARKEAAAGADAAPFVNSLIASHETICFAAGVYPFATEIDVMYLEGVTLSLDEGAVLQATSNRSLLLVYESPDTVVRGGEWVGPGMGNTSAIRVQYGSNDSVVEDTEVTKAGWNGILIYDNARPSFNVSVLDNIVKDNGRYGIQEFSNASTPMMGTVISGNVALDNADGGIYTNEISGVTITKNLVANTEGDGPGEIGIGVTNGHNDTITLNQVSHMTWFGIQAYYNNYTVISDNISTFNGGSNDQSGVTNDHSSFDTIEGNVVESNGRYGVYVERSWNVTVSGNIADGNGGYGIEFYHGAWPAEGRSDIVGNTCSSNGVGGIILNSAIDNVISTNQCYNNSGYGILLYNDPGQVGSTGNLVSGNWVGNEGGSQAQRFGISEANDSGNNTLVSNVAFNNTVAAVSLVPPQNASSN
jgi:parallel beta-helix repeat protein